MKKFFAIFFLVLSMYAGMALAGSNNPLLIGTWKSDRTLTTNYNKQIDKVSKNMVGFVDKKTGHMTITFAPDRLRSTGATQDVQIDGMDEYRGAHDFDAPYSIVSGDAHSISISMRDEASGSTSGMVFNFDDHDTMWVTAGGEGTSVADPRLRVYFKRVH